MKESRDVLIKECGEEMVLLEEGDFLLEPMYFKWNYSKTADMRLRSGVVARLRDAEGFLPQGWKFKLWDCFRTLETQQLLYDNYYDQLKSEHKDWDDARLRAAVEEFVAFPSHDALKPAPHNTGGAVDLTLVDRRGEEIEMGSEFDEFNEKSHTLYFPEDSQFYKNRKILKEAMEQAGFVNYREEWWHFSYGDQEWAYHHDESFAIYGSVEL